MHKKNRLNDLIPADDLYWDEEEKKHVIVSKEDEEKLIKACFNCDLKEDEVVKVLKYFTYYKTSEMLFKHFLQGNIGIYTFSKEGGPIFEKIRDNTQSLELACFQDWDKDYVESNYFEDDLVDVVKIEGDKQLKLGSSQPRNIVPFDRIYNTIIKWCEQRNFDIWNEENPDDETSWICERSEDLIKEIKQKGWSLEYVEAGAGLLYLRVKLNRWFFFDEDEVENES